MIIYKQNLVEWMFDDTPAAVNYWVRGGNFDGSKFEVGETVDYWVETHGPITITIEDFEKAITDWCNECARGHNYRYFDTFAKDWLWGDYYSADYDAAVIDQIFQWAAFGEIRYG